MWHRHGQEIFTTLFAHQVRLGMNFYLVSVEAERYQILPTTRYAETIPQCSPGTEESLLHNPMRPHASYSLDQSRPA